MIDPNGVMTLSPGLRRRRYPGFKGKNTHYPIGVAGSTDTTTVVVVGPDALRSQGSRVAATLGYRLTRLRRAVILQLGTTVLDSGASPIWNEPAGWRLRLRPCCRAHLLACRIPDKRRKHCPVDRIGMFDKVPLHRVAPPVQFELLSKSVLSLSHRQQCGLGT